jgi:hypothetical protein
MSAFAMYKALLDQQWKHQRVELTALSIAAAVACPWALWTSSVFESDLRPINLLNTSNKIAFAGSIAALLTGLLLATRPYSLDARSRHTYPLALPIPRALLRVFGGLTLVLVPAVSFFIGAVASAAAAPPAGLIHAFPMQLTLRFILACAFAFSIGFGVQYGLGRRAVRWMILVGLTLIGAEALGQLTFHVSMTEPFWSLIWHSGSPAHVFAAQWTLFNV